MMAMLAYLVSFGTAVGCAVLLTRAARRSAARLLFWSALCFWGLSLTNGLAIVDLYVVPQTDLLWIRLGVNFTSVCVLLYGMVWDSR
jgi:uncharacterized protein DUF5985